MEKEFNTLNAQRNACEGHIASQRAEGWVLVRGRYDDGSASGGTLEADVYFIPRRERGSDLSALT